MLTRESITVEKPEGHVMTAKERAAQEKDIVSFVQGVQLAHEHGWHPKLWKTLWDCGEAMLPKLRQAPAFWAWANRSREGRDWATAIGVQVITNTWLMDES